MALPRVIWAIGDLHGDAHCARHWLRTTGLIANLSHDDAASWRWQSPDARLVLLGDYVDKGPESRSVLELVRALTERFPAEVTALMGNHELNLLVDRSGMLRDGARYLQLGYGSAHPESYAQWLPARTASAEASRAGAEASLLAALARVYSSGKHDEVRMTAGGGSKSIIRWVEPSSRRLSVAAELRRWQAAYLDAVAHSTALGRWLENRPLTALVGDTLFVHGGVDPSLVSREGDAFASPSFATWKDYRAVLGRLNAGLRDVTSALPLVSLKKEEADAAAHDAFARHVWKHELVQSVVEWRGYHDRHGVHGGGCKAVRRVLQHLNLSRVVVGHTPGRDVRVSCGGKLLAIDSSLSRAFRASGNNYCAASCGEAAGGGASGEACSRVCPTRSERCEGQIVRLVRAGSEAAAGDGAGGEAAAAAEGASAAAAVTAAGREWSSDETSGSAYGSAWTERVIGPEGGAEPTEGVFGKVEL